MDLRLRQAQRALQRQQLENAAKGFLAVLAVAPEDPTAQRGREQVLQAVLARSQSQADDFQFDAAQRDAALAEALGASAAARRSSWRSACNVRSRHSGRCNSRRPATRSVSGSCASCCAGSSAPSAPGSGSVHRDTARSTRCVKRRPWRRAIPEVKAARRAPARPPGTVPGFDDNLRQNRVQAAGACLQAWQTLSPTANGLPAARQRLAQRWLAIGSERLGNGDVAFAERALQQAAELGAGASSSEYQQLRQRLRDIGVPSP